MEPRKDLEMDMGKGIETYYNMWVFNFMFKSIETNIPECGPDCF